MVVDVEQVAGGADLDEVIARCLEAVREVDRDLLSRRDLTGRMLGFGCVDSTTDRIESTAEIRKRIEKGVEIFDPKILLIDPDCGMRMRTREAAFAKLKYMCDAAKEVRLAL